MNIAFIRHGKTQGNIEKRYVGSNDQGISEVGATELRALFAEDIYPEVQHVYVSPMLRCRQTGELIYAGIPHTVVQGLREQHFGDFEDKDYAELENKDDFRQWISSNGEGTPTGGETCDELTVRCGEALAFVVSDAKEKKYDRIAVICHGGVMMRMFTCFAQPKRGFYDWLCKNGCGYLFVPDMAADGTIRLKLEGSIECESER